MLGLVGSLVGAACFADAPPVDTTAGSGSSGMPPGGECLPGSTQTCLCPGGADGVQACNADGSGLTECDCSSDPTDGPATTAADTTTTTSGGPIDTGSSGTTEGSGEVGSDGETDDPTTGPGGRPAYGPCPNGDSDCMANEACITTGGVMPETACLVQECVSNDECPPAPMGSTAVPQCTDIDGDSDTDCVLVCDSQPCPAGMICFARTFPQVCLWPT